VYRCEQPMLGREAVIKGTGCIGVAHRC
jgi:hypothetical protein